MAKSQDKSAHMTSILVVVLPTSATGEGTRGGPGRGPAVVLVSTAAAFASAGRALENENQDDGFLRSSPWDRDVCNGDCSVIRPPGTPLLSMRSSAMALRTRTLLWFHVVLSLERGAWSPGYLERAVASTDTDPDPSRYFTHPPAVAASADWDWEKPGGPLPIADGGKWLRLDPWELSPPRWVL